MPTIDGGLAQGVSGTADMGRPDGSVRPIPMVAKAAAPPPLPAAKTVPSAVLASTVEVGSKPGADCGLIRPLEPLFGRL